MASRRKKKLKVEDVQEEREPKALMTTKRISSAAPPQNTAEKKNALTKLPFRARWLWSLVTARQTAFFISGRSVRMFVSAL